MLEMKINCNEKRKRDYQVILMQYDDFNHENHAFCFKFIDRKLYIM